MKASLLGCWGLGICFHFANGFVFFWFAVRNLLLVQLLALTFFALLGFAFPLAQFCSVVRFVSVSWG